MTKSGTTLTVKEIIRSTRWSCAAHSYNSTTPASDGRVALPMLEFCRDRVCTRDLMSRGGALFLELFYLVTADSCSSLGLWCHSIAEQKTHKRENSTWCVCLSPVRYTFINTFVCIVGTGNTIAVKRPPSSIFLVHLDGLIPVFCLRPECGINWCHIAKMLG